MSNLSDFSPKWANFIGLVLFCIDADFCKKIFVGKLLTRSTRFTCFCTAQTSIFQKIFDSQTFSHFSAKFCKISSFSKKIHQNLFRFWWKLIPKWWIFAKFAEQIGEVWRNFAKILRSERCKACKSCRSRHELSNAYFLATFGVDTEENEP